MENQKIIDLLDKDDTDSKHFAPKKWYIINDENNTNYGVNKDTGANNPDTIKYDTIVLKPNLCDYADAYILVDGKIRAISGAPVGDPAAVPALDLTRLASKNCSPFTKYNLEINDEHVDTAENLAIVMPMYNLINILLNNKIKTFNDIFIGTNIKQKKKLKMQMLIFLSILI